jgi:hypothetical protein
MRHNRHHKVEKKTSSVNKLIDDVWKKKNKAKKA